jgi:hypothetical protein
MPAQWLRRIRRTGQLTFFNKASGWTVPIEAAVKSFNTLSLGVQFVAERTEKAANVVLVLANGPGVKYEYYTTGPKGHESIAQGSSLFSVMSHHFLPLFQHSQPSGPGVLTPR